MSLCHDTAMCHIYSEEAIFSPNTQTEDNNAELELDITLVIATHRCEIIEVDLENIPLSVGYLLLQACAWLAMG